MADKRTFIAIPLTEDVIGHLERVSTLLEPVSDGVKWVDPSLMHITLKFLGDTPEWMLEDVKQEFLRVMTGVAPFELQLKQLGQFPKEGDPRVFWAGLQKIPSIVYRLSDELNTGFISLGFDDTGKRFAPHITLGRAKQKLNDDLIPKFYDIELEPLVFPVDRIIWYESCYQHGKLTYIPLETFVLK